MFLAIFSVVILLGIGLYFLVKRLDKEVQEDKEYLPEDGLIYDPVSGRKLTLEEAESGIIVSDDMLSRIKSDEEIETFYAGDKKEKEYVERALITSGAASVDEDMLGWLDQSAIIRELASFHLGRMCEIIPGRYLGIAHIAYRLPGHDRAAGSEYQFIGFINGVSTVPHPAGLEDLETEVLSTGVLLRLPRTVTRGDLDKILALMREV